jgi:DNA invertase Pin-like site-specific DNA recombinase
MISFMAVMAKHERKAISERTRAALQAAKRRGTRKDGPPPADARRGIR